MPGGGAALSGPLCAFCAKVARPAGTMLEPSALPKIGLSADTARIKACCSLLPPSNAIEACNRPGNSALTICTAAALLPLPPPGESIGEPPGPPGRPTGDFGNIGGAPPLGGGMTGESGCGPSGMG